jgi:hypothetical protein
MVTIPQKDGEPFCKLGRRVLSRTSAPRSTCQSPGSSLRCAAEPILGDRESISPGSETPPALPLGRRLRRRRRLGRGWPSSRRCFRSLAHQAPGHSHVGVRAYCCLELRTARPPELPGKPTAFYWGRTPSNPKNPPLGPLLESGLRCWRCSARDLVPRLSLGNKAC